MIKKFTLLFTLFFVGTLIPMFGAHIRLLDYVYRTSCPGSLKVYRFQIELEHGETLQGNGFMEMTLQVCIAQTIASENHFPVFLLPGPRDEDLGEGANRTLEGLIPIGEGPQDPAIPLCHTLVTLLPLPEADVLPVLRAAAEQFERQFLGQEEGGDPSEGTVDQHDRLGEGNHNGTVPIGFDGHRLFVRPTSAPPLLGHRGGQSCFRS